MSHDRMEKCRILIHRAISKIDSKCTEKEWQEYLISAELAAKELQRIQNSTQKVTYTSGGIKVTVIPYLESQS